MEQNAIAFCYNKNLPIVTISKSTMANAHLKENKKVIIRQEVRK